MKIKEIFLENFRIFRGKHHFNLEEKKFILIYGPNGHGKSTIFDAISWLITGKIPKYQGSNEARFFNYIINFEEYYSGDSKASVEIILEDSENRVSIKRVDEESKSEKIFINGIEYGKKEGSQKIKDILSSQRGNANLKNDLSDLFSSTQILSQDTLQSFVISDKSVVRFRKIEEILGLRKYGEEFKTYLTKVKKVLNDEEQLLTEQLKELEIKKAIINTQLHEKHLQNSNLGRVTEEELTTKSNALLKKVKNQAFIEKTYLFKDLDELNEANRDTIVESLKVLDEKIKSVDVLLFKINQLSNKFIEEEEYKKAIKKLQNAIDSKKNLSRRRELGIKKAENAIKKIKSVSTEGKKAYEKLLKELENIDIRISNNNKIIDEFHNSEEILIVKKKFTTGKNFIKEYRLQKQRSILLEKLSSIETNNKKLAEINKHKVSIDKQIKEQVDKKEVLNKKVIELQKEVEKLSAGHTKHENSELRNLVYRLQNIILKNHNTSNCLVCGHDYNLPLSLNQAIQEEIKRVDNENNTLEKKLKALNNQIQELYSSIEKKQEFLSLLEKEKVKIDVTTQTLRVDNEKLLIQINSSQDMEFEENIQVDQKKNQEFLNAYSFAYELLENYMVTLNENKELKELHREKKNEITQYAKKLGRWKHYLNTDIEGINKKLSNYRTYILAANKVIDNLDEQIVVLDVEYGELLKRWESYNSLFKNLNKDHPEIMNNYTQIKGFKDKLFIEANKLRDLREEVNNHLIEVNGLIENNVILELKDKLKNLTSKELSLQRKQIEASTLIEDMDKFTKEHKDIQSKLIGEYLLKHSENINKFFRQISPHAIYKYVQLITKDNELYMILNENPVLISDKDINQLINHTAKEIKQKVNASLTFSAAQSTILALCVFLSLNLSQKWTKLKIIGIDDPFQNLDDVNVFSFIDVIKEIVSRGDKQIFISTHSEEFAKLLEAKIKLPKKEILKINIKTYNKEKLYIESSSNNYQFLE